MQNSMLKKMSRFLRRGGYLLAFLLLELVCDKAPPFLAAFSVAAMRKFDVLRHIDKDWFTIIEKSGIIITN